MKNQNGAEPPAIAHHAILAFCAIACLAAGCLKVEQVVTLNADGSGSAELSYAISEDSVQRAKAMIRLRDQFETMSGSPARTNTTLADMFLAPDEVQLRKEFKRHESSGITVEQLRVRSHDNWRHVQLKLSFKKLADAARSELFNDCGFTLAKSAKGNFILFRDKADQADMLPASSDPATAKALAPLLQGLRIDIKVVVPGTILQSNAHRASPNTANWVFDYDQDANALINLQKQQFKIHFEGKDVKLPTIMSPRHEIGS
jgi:hypothetical protein